MAWSSSDPTIANIGGNGVVEGESPGSITITAASAVIPTVTGTATVKVIQR